MSWQMSKAFTAPQVSKVEKMASGMVVLMWIGDCCGLGNL